MLDRYHLARMACTAGVAASIAGLSGGRVWPALVVFTAMLAYAISGRDTVDERLEHWAIPPIATMLVLYQTVGVYPLLAFCGLCARMNLGYYREEQAAHRLLLASPCGIQGCGCGANRDEANPWKLARPECTICLGTYADEPVFVLGVSVHCRHVFHAACLYDYVKSQGAWINVLSAGHYKLLGAFPRPGCPICRRMIVGVFEFRCEVAVPPVPAAAAVAWSRDAASKRLNRV